MHITLALVIAALLATGLPVAGNVEAPSKQTICGEIGGLEALLEKGNILVFGELHGTEESPTFVGDVTCRALRSGLSVTLGLELLDSEAPRINAFLESAGSEADRALLSAGGSWSAAYQDGRTSEAMLELLDRVRILRATGKPVTVELFDRRGWQSGQDRDRLMARALAGVLEISTSDILVILTGNIHSRITRGTPWSEAYEPMTHLLAKLTERKLVSLDVAHAGGSAWMCSGSVASSCGVRQVSLRETATGRSVELGAGAAATGHHGKYHVGRLNASPPARRQ